MSEHEEWTELGAVRWNQFAPAFVEAADRLAVSLSAAITPVFVVEKLEGSYSITKAGGGQTLVKLMPKRGLGETLLVLFREVLEDAAHSAAALASKSSSSLRRYTVNGEKFYAVAVDADDDEGHPGVVDEVRRLLSR